MSLYYSFKLTLRFYVQGARLRWCDIEPCPTSWAATGLLCDQRCPVPASCVVRPNGHKTCQRRNAGRFTVFRDEDTPNHIRASRFMPGLPALLAAYAAAGYAPTPIDPVFPQCAPGGSQLLPVPSTCGSLRQVVARAAKATPLAAKKFSSHSFRRGRMLQDKHDGVPCAQTCTNLLGITPGTYAHYTDESRPTRAEVSLSPCPGGALVPSDQPHSEVESRS